MNIVKTTFDKIKKYRIDYFNSLPEFQELFIELMIDESDFFLLTDDDKEIGYTIRNNEGILIEFFIQNQYQTERNMFFNQTLKELSIEDIYCKSFDSLLLSNCLNNSFSYSVVGILFRDFIEGLLKKDPEIRMQKTDLSSLDYLLKQDNSIKELFETEQQLKDFILNENVFLVYKNDDFIGCGMVIKTNTAWNFCDLGVWVKPSKRGNNFGSQIIVDLREFAIQNKLNPSCGCAVENIASQKTIEKAGFRSKYRMIHFTTSEVTAE